MDPKELEPDIEKSLEVLRKYLNMDAEPTELYKILGMDKITGGPSVYLTELDSDEILIISALQAINSIYDSKVLDNFIRFFLINKMSNKRKGRMELVEILKQGPEEEVSRLGKIREAMGNWMSD